MIPNDVLQCPLCTAEANIKMDGNHKFLMIRCSKNHGAAEPRCTFSMITDLHTVAQILVNKYYKDPSE